MQGSNETFEALLEYVEIRRPDDRRVLRHAWIQRIDIQNYIEYMAIEIFTGNTDTLNVKRYRNSNADGKWRWMLFDLDWAFDGRHQFDQPLAHARRHGQRASNGQLAVHRAA